MLKVNDVLQEFRKDELLAILTELEIPFQVHTMARKLIETIIADLNENGIPDPLDEEECSELLYNFLYIAGYIDEDGNVLDEESDNGKVAKDEVKNKQENPPCWGFQDDLDPSCKRCKLQEQCRTQKENSRPDCYGRLFDISTEDCKMCLLASYCKIEVDKNRQKT